MKLTSLAVIFYFSTMSLLEGAALATPEVVPLLPYPRVAGNEVVHSVQPGDTIDRISRRFGVGARLAMAMNRLGDGTRLKKGQRLTLSNRRIVPSLTEDGVVINVADRVLYWIQRGVLMAQFPVGVGREAWETPLGQYAIQGRRRDPVWHVPPSIQREMAANGVEVKTIVPAGPGNPLGKYWIQLSAGGIGIHGTNKPWTVGKYATHGCIRMRADDIEWLYYNVPTGTSVEIVDEPVKFARLGDGTLLMEAHPLRKKHTQRYTADRVAARLQAAGLAELADVPAIERTMRNAWGVAVDVTRRPARSPLVSDVTSLPHMPSAPPMERQRAELHAGAAGTPEDAAKQPNDTVRSQTSDAPAHLPDAVDKPQPPALDPHAASDTATDTSTTVAVETYRRPDNYIWSGGRQMRVGRP